MNINELNGRAQALLDEVRLLQCGLLGYPLAWEECQLAPRREALIALAKVQNEMEVAHVCLLKLTEVVDGN